MRDLGSRGTEPSSWPCPLRAVPTWVFVPMDGLRPSLQNVLCKGPGVRSSQKGSLLRLNTLLEEREMLFCCTSQLWDGWTKWGPNIYNQFSVFNIVRSLKRRRVLSQQTLSCCSRRNAAAGSQEPLVTTHSQPINAQPCLMHFCLKRLSLTCIVCSITLNLQSTAI